MNNLIEHKRPYIKDIKEFLMVAKYFGFNLYSNATLRKTLYFKDLDIKIIINLQTSQIRFECFKNNVSAQLSFDDKCYLMRAFEHYVDWN